MRSRRITPFVLTLAVLVSLFAARSAAAQVANGDYTYAVEINGVVCGYADVHVSSVDAAAGPYTLFEQSMFMMMSALGSEFNTIVDVEYHIDPASGDFTFMQSRVQQDALTFDFEVRIDGRTAYCTSSLQPEETRVELDGGVIIGNPLYSAHLVQAFAGGDREELTCAVFDAMEFKVQDTKFSWGGAETLELAGERHDALVVDSLSLATGVKMRMWIDAVTGLTLKVTGPQGTAYLADPAVKKRIQLVNRDENILVRTNVAIPDIRRLSYMKVDAVIEPTGQWITPEDLNVPGQKFTGTVIENRIEGVFEIEHVHFDGAGAPAFPAPAIDDASLREYLEPGRFVESGDPVLIAEARALTSGAADSWEAAVRLSQWVADNIAYEIPGGGTARRTYDLRAGECGSHSILLATFCRAVGIPARVVWGCMYTPNLGGAFGQHGWTEVHMGPAGWIPVDSTAHEAGFVDSGHVRLGEHQSFATALNAESMEILDYRVTTPSVDAPAEGESGKYAAYLGEYDPPGGGEAFEVLVVNGGLAIDIPGQTVLAFNDADADGRWYCSLSSNLYCTFDHGDDGRVGALRFHELVRMRRIADPDTPDEGVPDGLRPFLGSYRFPGRPEPFRVSCDDGRLAVWYESRQALVHMEPTAVEGRWIDEHGTNGLTFDRDEQGAIRALILEVVSSFTRVPAATAGVEVTDLPVEPSASGGVDALLDDFNRAATSADFEAYSACLAPDAVFIGTDVNERWTADELRAFVKPHFDQGRGSAHTPRERHVVFFSSGDAAVFDELVEIDSLGICRGTGTAIKLGDGWLIQQYSLSFPVPNAIAQDVADRISRYHGEPAVDDDADIRASLEAYLATATFPGPQPIDPESFGTDIEAFWSSGATFRGRAAVVRALKEGQRELEAAFASFAATADQVHIRRRGDLASVACRIELSGVRSTDGAPFSRTVQSTFVFERVGGRWRMVQEHSTLVEQPTPS